MLLNAKPYVEAKMKELKERLSELDITPKLAIIQVEGNQASDKYVGNKKKKCAELGIPVELYYFSKDVESHTIEEKIAELNDRYLRLVAEFDNYRKRVIREKAELIKNGGEKVITTILPILDDMERAEQNMKNAEDLEAVKTGIVLIFEKLQKLLQQEGLEKMDVVGSAFDTDYHEAMAMVPGMGDDKKGKVIDCIMNGYKLNDKVIRHAKVAVAE